jgi:peptidoglycan/xylan/chitin deacetylase (PgdA/CDA1 family)
MYDFSDYFKSNTASELDATIVMADGSQQYMYLGTAFDSPNSWTKFDTQFTAPAGAVGIYVYHDIYSVGYVITDDFSLTPFKYQGFTRPLVTITDDDGFTNFYTNGLPVLQKYNLPSTAYIISSYIGQPDYVSSSQVKTLYQDGVEIGSHSVDHPDLTALTAAQQDAELKNSQSTLQSLLGVQIKDYAAPYGAFNQQVTTDAKKYYQTYRTTMPGYNGKNNFNAMNLYVQNITSSTTTADVQGWLQEAAATNTWLILVYHEISTTPSDATYNTLPSDFDSQMAAVKSSGITVETVSQAMQEITPQL